MKRPPFRRRLIVTADDFGASPAVNRAVRQAHTTGILTSASLMVNEPASAEAVEIARQHPSLAVGLHLALVCGRAALKPDQIPGIAGADGFFSQRAVNAGLRYFFARSLREPLRAEIHEQFRRFRATGLDLDHVNGHLHMHLHPTVLSILIEDAATLGIRRMRLARDPLRLNLRLSKHALPSRAAHWAIFRSLSRHAAARFRTAGISHTDQVFGLLQNGHVTESYLLGLLVNLPPGESELYSHPSTDHGNCELPALVSPAVRARVRELGIELTSHGEIFP